MARITRRTALKQGAAAGAAVIGTPFIRHANAQTRKSVRFFQEEPFTGSWDPSSHSVLAQMNVEHYLFGRLIQTPMQVADPFAIEYDLATSQTIVDPWTIEYTLRDDVFFHDGKKFGPEDVKATFEYASGPDRPARGWYPGQTEVEIVDATTIRVRSADQSFAGGMFWLLSGFLPILSADDIANNALGERPNGTGYFKFDSREGQTTRLAAFDQYHFGRPEIDEYITTFVGDSNTRLLGLMNNEVDLIARLEPEQYESLLSDGRFKLAETVSTENKYMHFRSRPPFDDVRVRHAACHAIDRSLLVELLGPAGQASVGHMSPVKLGYNPDLQGYPEYDPERCQQLLAEAGYPRGEGMPDIDFVVSMGFYPKNKEYAEVITAMMQEQGFPVTLRTQEVSAWLETIYDVTSENRAHVVDTGYMTGSPDPNVLIRPLWHSVDGGLLGENLSPELDAIIDAQQMIGDPVEREAYLQNTLMPALTEQMPSYSLFTSVLLHAMNQELDGVRMFAYGPMDLSRATWTS